MAKEKSQVSISRWHVQPTTEGHQLCGTLLVNGQQVEHRSASLEKVDFESGFAETRNTIYELVGE